jgi:hypothetical protein
LTTRLVEIRVRDGERGTVIDSSKSTPDEVSENTSEGARAAEVLLRLASGARFFRSSDGRFHARVPVGNRNDIVRLKSAAFRDWLVDGYLNECRRLPSHRAVRRVVEALEARARFGVDTPTVYVRVGRGREDNGPVYYLDLADPSGRAVEVRATGWATVDRPDAHFRRPRGCLPLPVPGLDGSIELLRPYVNVTDADFHLLIGWMAAALKPAGPYPILVIHGEQGSAKSTLARMIRLLIDPQSAPLLAEPRSTRDLMVTAVNCWLLAFDNVSVLPIWLADSLCRLSSGGGFASRALFSDDEHSVIHAQRPVILNGIDEFVRRGDLADRVVFLNPPPIKPTSRRGDDEFWASFTEAYPRILGGLLDAVAGALRELPSVHLTELPRMADFARFGEAVGRGLGWPAGTFLSAYNGNRRDASAAAIEDSVLGKELIDLACRGGLKNWTAPPGQMLDELNDLVGRTVARSAGWPKTPSMLSNELRRLAPQLRAHGVDVTFTRTHKGRLITLSRRASSDCADDTP